MQSPLRWKLLSTYQGLLGLKLVTAPTRPVAVFGGPAGLQLGGIMAV